MNFSEMNVTAFSDALASKTAVPGGGGASALVCALGAALCSMVGNFTLGKPKFAAYESQLTDILAQAQALRRRGLQLVSADAEAFAPLSRAYALPKDAPDRAEEIERCLHTASQVPLEILRCACQSIDLLARIEDKCSNQIVSDVATGAVLCWSALYGAAINVRVNTHLMQDRAFAEKLNAETDALMQKYWVIADGIYERTWEKLK